MRSYGEKYVVHILEEERDVPLEGYRWTIFFRGGVQYSLLFGLSSALKAFLFYRLHTHKTLPAKNSDRNVLLEQLGHVSDYTMPCCCQCDLLGPSISPK